MEIIGFIGLGNMGAPMAANLVKAGYMVKGFDLSEKALELFSSQGGTPADTLSDAVANADFVISMLPAGRHVEALYCSEEHLLDIINKKTLVIDTSTIDAETARKVAEHAAEKGIAFMDAPVSGGVTGAVNGTVTFIAGGNKKQLEQARPVLESMGSHIFLAGSVGSGQLAKACNNMLLGILMAGTSEALALGAASGLDVRVLSEIMLKSSGRNWALELYNPVPDVMDNSPASRGYQGGFMNKLMIKDLGLAMTVAEEKGANVPLGSLTRNLYKLHAEKGNEHMDFSSIYQLFLNRQL